MKRFALALLLLAGSLPAHAQWDLAIGVTHDRFYAQGVTGRQITISVSLASADPTCGAGASDLTVTAQLPVGLVATGLAGSGWTDCSAPIAGPATLTCQRVGLTSFTPNPLPPITLTVDVASNAPASVSTAVSIAGTGGCAAADPNPSNNSATDSSTVLVRRLAGFCRERGTGNILPLQINTETGVGLLMGNASLGADAAGHFSAVSDNSGLSGDGTDRFAIGFSSGSPSAESLLTFDPDTGVVTPSSSPLPAEVFAGGKLAERVGEPWRVVIAQEVVGEPTTATYSVEVASGAAELGSSVPFTAPASTFDPFSGPPVPYIDPTRPQFLFVLQPCTASAFQQLTRVTMTTNPWTVAPHVDLNASSCLHTAGASANRHFALVDLGADQQFARVNPVSGLITFVGDSFPWRWSPAAPYVYGRSVTGSMDRLYLLDAPQRRLAIVSLLTGDHEFVDVTLPSACATVTAFAGTSYVDPQ